MKISSHQAGIAYHVERRYHSLSIDTLRRGNDTRPVPTGHPMRPVHDFRTRTGGAGSVRARSDATVV
eukprot:scaffold6178_cov180-Amphora_coffeaeformis.AAC.4